jgi:benzoyl-CoA reductase subunit D
MIISAGVDVGTSAVKVALVASPRGTGRERTGARLLGRHTERIRRRDQRLVIELAYARALEAASIERERVDYVATTGEGELVDFRTGHFYSMTAHARGAILLDPGVRAAIDVGALHARAIKFDERAKVLDYRMTSQCASGTGQFLENIVRYLGVTLEEVGALSSQGTQPEKISGICAVLAETDVINMVSRGVTVPNILRGIHESLAAGFTKLLRGVKVSGPVLLTGGLSADRGLLDTMNEAMRSSKLANVEIRTDPDAVHAGAIGAALWGAYRQERLEAEGKTREVELA